MTEGAPRAPLPGLGADGRAAEAPPITFLECSDSLCWADADRGGGLTKAAWSRKEERLLWRSYDPDSRRAPGTLVPD